MLFLLCKYVIFIDINYLNGNGYTTEERKSNSAPRTLRKSVTHVWGCTQWCHLKFQMIALSKDQLSLFFLTLEVSTLYVYDFFDEIHLQYRLPYDSANIWNGNSKTSIMLSWQSSQAVFTDLSCNASHSSFQIVDILVPTVNVLKSNGKSHIINIFLFLLTTSIHILMFAL